MLEGGTRRLAAELSRSQVARRNLPFHLPETICSIQQGSFQSEATITLHRSDLLIEAAGSRFLSRRSSSVAMVKLSSVLGVYTVPLAIDRCSPNDFVFSANATTAPDLEIWVPQLQLTARCDSHVLLHSWQSLTGWLNEYSADDRSKLRLRAIKGLTLEILQAFFAVAYDVDKIEILALLEGQDRLASLCTAHDTGCLDFIELVLSTRVSIDLWRHHSEPHVRIVEALLLIHHMLTKMHTDVSSIPARVWLSSMSESLLKDYNNFFVDLDGSLKNKKLVDNLPGIVDAYYASSKTLGEIRFDSALSNRFASEVVNEFIKCAKAGIISSQVIDLWIISITSRGYGKRGLESVDYIPDVMPVEEMKDSARYQTAKRARLQ
jgi:hypothetical protein